MLVMLLILMQLMLLLINLELRKKTADKTDNDSTKDVKIMVPLKRLSSFWRTLEVPLINCVISLDLNWFANCVTVTAAVSNQSATFLISDTKTCVSIVSLSTQNNKKPVFQRIIEWNRYPSKVSTETTNQYLGCLIDPSF